MSQREGTPDAQLVAEVLAGDRDAFAQVYDRYADRLHDFAHSMLRHPEEAADAVADSFVLMAEKLGQLRDPDRLRPWLYSVVRHECLRRLRGRSRIAYDGEARLMDMPDDASSPDREAEVAALRTLVWDAAAGLGERDLALLDLHLRHGLEGAELGEAMGISAGNAYTSLNRLRAQVERSLGALLIARLGRKDCADLGAILTDWDGRFSPLVRKRVARHVDDCGTCTRRRATIVSPWALLSGVPLLPAPAALRDRVLEDSRMVAHYASPGSGSGGVPAARRRAVATGAGVAAAGVVVLLVLLVPGRDPALTDAVSEPGTSEAPVTYGPSLSASASPSPTAEDDPPSPTPAPPAGSTAPSSTPPAPVSGSSTAPAPPDPVAEVTSAAPEPVPAALELSTRRIDLGTSANSGSVTLTNLGGAPLAFQVAPGDGWLTVTPASGSIPAGGSTTLGVLADRANLPPGQTSRTVFTVGWSGAPAPVLVEATQPQPIG